MNADEFSARLDLFYGATNVNTATVYARLNGQATGQGVTIGGFIRGPHCLHSTMLPATIRLADAGSGESLLAKAIVPDPCYWTPELPALYDVHLELKRDGEVIAASDRTLGLRQFGPRGKFFYQNGKRWTVRAAYSPAPPADLLAWHDTPLSLCMDCPSDGVCDEASRVGVMILARLSAAHDLEAEIRRLARHAAVAIIVLDIGAPANPIPANLQQLAPNVVLARYRHAQHVAADDAWDVIGAAALVERTEEISALGEDAGQFNLPIIAERLLATPVDPAEAREACDQLQADLASICDFAGYLV